MQLISLKIHEPYKSINSFNYTFRQENDVLKEVEPLCFVGLNGSGKSNIIEALSEIFCFLDLYCLQYSNTPKWALKSPMAFDVEYSIASGKKNIVVYISALKNKAPVITTDETGKSSDPETIASYLPNHILGYSSGHNETISFPYLRNQGFYADEILRSALKTDGELDVRHTKTLLMDYDSNVLILLANFLFSSLKKRQLFTDNLRIKDVSSFRIIIDFAKKPTGAKVETTNEIDETVEKLKSCALMFQRKSDLTYVFDFVVNQATRKAFKYHFDGAIDFYTRLYKLNLLNALRMTGKERDFYTKQSKLDTLLEKPPTVAKQNKVFCVDQLKLNLSEPRKEINYVGISDGEHQFIHVMGTAMLFAKDNCLFLFDEPESHFNPLWRSSFIKILSDVIGDNKQEFILSTHSPYVVSACYSRNVLMFTRNGDRIEYSQPSRETYGGTFEHLLKELFGLSSSISEYSQQKLMELITSGDIDEMELAAANFAESPEKRVLYEAILRLEQEEGESN